MFVFLGLSAVGCIFVGRMQSFMLIKGEISLRRHWKRSATHERTFEHCRAKYVFADT